MALCIAALVLAVSAVTYAEDITTIRPTGYVTDLAGILQPQARTQLEAMCTELEQKTGAQMAVVTVKSLDGEQVQQYANDLFKHLGVGKQKESNGVLLLVAPNDRKYWTEVGYGLEPVINDARAGDAGRLMVPYFRQGDYSRGVTAAAAQLAKYIADDKGVTLTGIPQVRPLAQRHQSSGGAGLWIVLGIILFVVLFAGRSSSSGQFSGRRRGTGGGWWIGPTGGGWGGGSWGGSGGSWGGGGGGGFGGFGGGSSGGGGAGGSW